jgi:hypothetical protein
VRLGVWFPVHHMLKVRRLPVFALAEIIGAASSYNSSTLQHHLEYTLKE